MKDKSTEELLIILSEVCQELEARCVGIADHGGKMIPVIEQNGNTVTCLHIGSNLGVSVFKESMNSIKTVMLEKDQTLQGATGLSRFIKTKTDGKESK